MFYLLLYKPNNIILYKFNYVLVYKQNNEKLPTIKTETRNSYIFKKGYIN